MAFQTFSIILIITAFLLVFFLQWLNRKYFLDLFKKIPRLSLILLLLLIAIYSLILILKGFNFKTFIPSDLEWELFRQAKELIQGEQILRHLRYGLFYPLLLSFGSLIFGFSPLVASIMNYVFGILSIILVFALSQAVFKNDKISLASSIIYAFTPLVYAFITLQMGFPTIMTFFLLSFSLTAILYFKHHKTSLLIQSLLLIILTSQIKPEYFILIIPFVICFVLFKEYKRINLSKILILIILFLLFSSPYLVKNYYFKASYANGWCGTPSKTFPEDGSLPKLINLPLAKQIDPILKILLNNRFSFNYFILEMPNFIKFWTFRSLFFISILIIIGFVSGFKKHLKEFIFLLFLFSLISFPYLADCNFYESRYAIPTYGLVVIFAGFGLYLIIEKISEFTKKPNSTKLILLITAILSLLIYWYFNEYRTYLFDGAYHDYMFIERRSSNDYSRLNSLLKNIPKKRSFFFTAQPNEADILRIIGYESIALGNINTINQMNRPSLRKIKLPLDKTKSNYFIESWYCLTLMDLRTLCRFVKENYKLKLIKQTKDDNLFLILAK